MWTPEDLRHHFLVSCHAETLGAVDAAEVFCAGWSGTSDCKSDQEKVGIRVAYSGCVAAYNDHTRSIWRIGEIA